MSRSASQLTSSKSILLKYRRVLVDYEDQAKELCLGDSQILIFLLSLQGLWIKQDSILCSEGRVSVGLLLFNIVMSTHLTLPSYFPH